MPRSAIRKGICGMTRRWIGLHLDLGPFYLHLQAPRPHPRWPSRTRLVIGWWDRYVFDSWQQLEAEEVP